MPPEKDYGLNLCLYSNDEKQLLAERKKLLIAAIVFLVLGSFTIKLYIGVFLIIISLFLFSGASTRKKVIAQSHYEKAQIENVLNIKEVIPCPDLSIIKDFTRSISSMPIIDFTTIRKNTPYSKIFPLIVLDVETTGLDRQNDKIVEVSALKFESSFTPSQRYTTLIFPEIEIPSQATNVNSITNDMVKNAPLFSQIKPQFEEFIKGCNIAGYNVRFDLEFLYRSGVELSEDVHYFDVYALAKKRIRKNEVNDYKLVTICKYFDIPTINSHRSLYDSFATAKVFEKIYTSK